MPLVDLSGRQFERILLIKPSSLGDVIHALPVLRGLRRQFPEARIDWLIGTPFAPLLHGHPDVTELVLFDRRRFGRMAFSPRAASEFVGFMGELRARRYDLAIDLQGLFRSGFITRATGAPVRLGFQDAREGARMFYTHRMAPPASDMHAVDKNYLVAGVLGFADLALEFHLPIAAEARAEAERLCGNVETSKRQNVKTQSDKATERRSDEGENRGIQGSRDQGIEGLGRHGGTKARSDGEDTTVKGSSAEGHAPGARVGGFTVVVAPGARWETKRWLPERFAETIDRLSMEESCSVTRCILVGGKEDQEICSAVVARCGQPVVDLSGRTSLPTLVALIERADLVLCHDSGVAHIAAALDRPLICITGPTNPRRTGPYARARDVLRLKLECSPCYLRRLSQCPHQHRCMRELTVEEVVTRAWENVETGKLKTCSSSR